MYFWWTSPLKVAKTLKNKKVFLGAEVDREIRNLGLNPDSPQVKWLLDGARRFHVTSCKYLIKYFSKALTSVAMDNMGGLHPEKQSHLQTPRKLKSLASQYSKVVDNIQKFGGMDKIRDEIDQYSTDDSVSDLDKDVLIVRHRRQSRAMEWNSFFGKSLTLLSLFFSFW